MVRIFDLTPRPESVPYVFRAMYACGRIADDIAVGHDVWINDYTRQDAVMYRLVILGECMKRFLDLYEGKQHFEKQEEEKRSKKQPGRANGPNNRDERFLKLRPQDYSHLIKLRDRLAHLTAEHDLAHIWDVATNVVPPIAVLLQSGARWVTPAELQKAGKTREEEFVATVTKEWLKEELSNFIHTMTANLQPTL